MKDGNVSFMLIQGMTNHGRIVPSTFTQLCIPFCRLPTKPVAGFRSPLQACVATWLHLGFDSRPGGRRHPGRVDECSGVPEKTAQKQRSQKGPRILDKPPLRNVPISHRGRYFGRFWWLSKVDPLNKLNLPRGCLRVKNQKTRLARLAVLQ